MVGDIIQGKIKGREEGWRGTILYSYFIVT